jgi:hypothetical protein
MARAFKPLSPTTLRGKGPGLHHDGRGLYLQIKNGGRSWVFRFMQDGKARCMGLGPFPGVTLAKARRKAEEARALLHDGVDPLEHRKELEQSARLTAAKAVTFKEGAQRYIEAHRSGWRNPKHAAPTAEHAGHVRLSSSRRAAGPGD